jgi:hypothetical protein
MDLLPAVQKVFSMLLQQEREQGSSIMSSQVLYAAVGDKSKVKGSKSQKFSSTKFPSSKVCVYCKKTGHLIDTCYKLHGLPPHLKKTATVNHFQADSEDDSDDDAPSVVSQKGGSEGSSLAFTPEQHRALLSLLQHSNAGSPPSHFVN